MFSRTQFSFPGRGEAYKHSFDRDVRLRSTVKYPRKRITQDPNSPKIKQPKIHSLQKMVLQDSFPYGFRRMIIKLMLLFKYRN